MISKKWKDNIPLGTLWNDNARFWRINIPSIITGGRRRRAVGNGGGCVELPCALNISLEKQELPGRSVYNLGEHNRTHPLCTTAWRTLAVGNKCLNMNASPASLDRIDKALMLLLLTGGGGGGGGVCWQNTTQYGEAMHTRHVRWYRAYPNRPIYPVSAGNAAIMSGIKGLTFEHFPITVITANAQLTVGGGWVMFSKVRSSGCHTCLHCAIQSVCVCREAHIKSLLV